MPVRAFQSMGPELLLLAGILAQAPTASGPTLTTGDTVVVVERDRAIRGRLRDITADALAIDVGGTPGRLEPPSMRRQTAEPVPWMMFARGGWAGFSDDEGSLGDGAAFGGGILMPLGRRGGLQLTYDRHTHRRDIASGAPPGLNASGGGFHGTEQIFSAKALLFFREGKIFRPYAGLGGGLLDSRRTSEFPSYLTVGGSIVPGPTEVISYRTNEFAVGFAAGGLWRLTPRFSILGDLSLDLAADGLSSSRLTVGAGYGF